MLAIERRVWGSFSLLGKTDHGTLPHQDQHPGFGPSLPLLLHLLIPETSSSSGDAMAVVRKNASAVLVVAVMVWL